MIEYDAAIIRKFAKKLYDQAATTVAIWSILGLVAGAVGGMAAKGRSSDTGLVVLIALVGGVLGYAIGQARAFMLRLQAQTALCQLQIERNTRRARHEEQRDPATHR